MQYTQQAAAVTAEVNKAVQGKQQTVNTIWMAMLAGGHVLIEDIPGVGKTTLALAFARALDLKASCSLRRMFCRPIWWDFPFTRKRPASLCTTPVR